MPSSSKTKTMKTSVCFQPSFKQHIRSMGATSSMRLAGFSLVGLPKQNGTSKKNNLRPTNNRVIKISSAKKLLSHLHTIKALHATGKSNRIRSASMSSAVNSFFSLQDALHLGGDAAKRVWDNRDLIADLTTGGFNLATGNFAGAAVNAASAVTRIPNLIKSLKRKRKRARGDQRGEARRGDQEQWDLNGGLPSERSTESGMVNSISGSPSNQTSFGSQIRPAVRIRGAIGDPRRRLEEGNFGYLQPRAQSSVSTQNFGGPKRFVATRFVKNLKTPVAQLMTDFNVEVFDVTPINSELFVWLSSIANNYQLYKVHKLRLCFKPVLGTDTVGSVAMGFYMDPENSIAFSETSLLNLQKSESGPLWVLQSADLNDTELDTRKIYFTAPDVNNSNASVQCQFVVGTSYNELPETIYGQLWIEYDIELRTPQISEGLGIYTVGRNVPLAPGLPFFDHDTKITSSNFSAQYASPNQTSITFLQKGYIAITCWATADVVNTAIPPAVLIVNGEDTTLLGNSVSFADGIGGPGYLSWVVNMTCKGVHNTTVTMPPHGQAILISAFTINRLSSDPAWRVFPSFAQTTSLCKDIAVIEAREAETISKVNVLETRIKALNLQKDKQADMVYLLAKKVETVLQLIEEHSPTVNLSSSSL